MALTLGSLAIPAAALADGQLDPAFNFTGAHVGSAAEGTLFSNVDTRIPMIVQANGSVVIGGSRGGFMTLARYTAAGALDPTFGVGGFATMQFAGTAGSAPGNSGATAMTQVGTDIIVGGFGASQSMVAARFSANGTFTGAAVCFAPHLIDYTARAVAARPNGTVVLAGYARDRWPTQAVPALPAALYGQRAVVAVPTNGTIDTATCGSTAVAGQGSAGVRIDGLNHDGTGADPTVSGRYYDGVAALPDNSYVVASTNGPDANVTAGNAAWVLRFTAAGALDTTFNATGAGSILPVPGRLPIANVNLHAIKLLGTDAYAAGEALGGTADSRTMVVARVDTNGALVPAFSGDGIAAAKVGGGNNSGQALIFQGANVIVGGGANLAGKSAFGMTRFNATSGAHDAAFGPNGQVVTPFGAPAVNGYITGMALSAQGLIDVSGRLTDPAGLATVAARYYAVGSPPPLPAPAASTMGVDQVTTSSARVSGTINTNGVASTWWIEYGTTPAYGAATAAQPLPASLDDIGVQGVVSGLAAGTAYHARIVISNTQGTVGGDDVTFTTLGTATAGAGGGTTGATTGGATTGGSTGTTTGTANKKAKAKACIVPKVTGKKLNKARSTVYAKGCKVQVKYVKSAKAKNTVLSQSRKAGKRLGYRSVVKLTVATTAAALKKS